MTIHHVSDQNDPPVILNSEAQPPQEHYDSRLTCPPVVCLSFPFSRLQAYEDLKLQLDQERAARTDQAEQQRQSFSFERAAISKRHQAAVKELVSKHEAEVKKLRRKLKAADASILQLSDELTELRLK